MEKPIDELDAAILDVLQAEGRISNRELARRLDVPPATVLDRVRKLERRGVIDQYVALVNPKKVGLQTICLVSVALASHLPDVHAQFQAHVADLQEVLACYLVSGESDYMLKVAVPDLEAYEHFLMQRLNRIEGVHRIQTAFILRAVKEETKLPFVVV